MRVRTIIDKEWEEILKNGQVFWSLVLLPLILTVVFLGVLFFMRLELARTGELRTTSETPPPAYLAGYDRNDAVQIMLLNQFLVYFLMTPLALPIYIAAYSIIGEKQTRSLEPLLATPVRTWELLFGKAVAAVVPPVVAGWVSYALFALGARLLVSDVVFGAIVSPMWLLAMAILSPLFALLSVLMGVIASSRTNDPRAAQQWSALFIIPLVGIGMAMMFGVIATTVWTFAVGVLTVLLLDAGMLHLAVRVFQREVILTRWK
jgi:ABC-2 type transport system permease protein